MLFFRVPAFINFGGKTSLHVIHSSESLRRMIIILLSLLTV